MNGAPLMHQLLAEPFLQRLAQAAPAVGHEQNPLGEDEAAALQVSERHLTDLVILSGAFANFGLPLHPSTSALVITASARSLPAV